MPGPTIARTAALSAFAFFALTALVPARAAAQAAEPPPETFTEDVTVREASVVVDVPATLRRRALVPAEVRVFEDGQPRPVTRVEPFPGRADLVVWLDGPLARGATRFESALALARQAAGLAGAGTVEVVTAAPEPKVELPATDSAERLAAVLGEIAARARREADGPPQGSDVKTVRRQLDRLLLYLAGRQTEGPHLLLYVADGSDAAAVQPLFAEAGETLAAYGWTVVGFAVKSSDPGEPKRGLTDTNRVIDTTSRRDDPPPPIFQPKPTNLEYDKVLDAFVQSGSASLRALSQPTAGTLVAIERQLGTFLRALPERRRVWYLPTPPDGRDHTLEVRLAAGGKVLRGQTRARSATPQALAEVRLRALLLGDAARGDLPFTARLAAGGERRLELHLAASDKPTVVGPLRLSVAYEGAAGPTFHHEMLKEGLVAEGDWKRAVPVAVPPGSRRVAVLLEDLGRSEWDGEVLDVAVP